MTDTATRKKMTYADLQKIPEDGFRHEILEGDWYMTPAPGIPHQKIVVNLTLILGRHVMDRKLGLFLASPVDVVLSNETVVEPDAVYVSTDRSSIITTKELIGAPDLVVEVLSPTTAAVDQGKKRELYAASGVREYWIIDPAARTIQIHEFAAVRRVRSYRESDSFASDLFPALEIKGVDLFA